MPEIIEPPQVQSQTEKLSGMDRLSQDPQYIFGEPEIKAEVKTEPVSITKETEILENPEKAAELTEPVKTETPDPEPAKTEPVEEVGFEDAPQATQEEGTWRNIIETFGYPIPEDYTEEKGQEIFAELKEAEMLTRLEEVKNYKETEIFSSLPEKVQGEAKLLFELFKTGQTLNEINAPREQIKAWKAMPKEELIRKNLENIPGYTQEMIDHKMEQIVAANHIDVEHQILINEIGRLESQINSDEQERIQIYTAQQNQIKDQRRQQEFNSFKAALDKVPMFMEKKISDENKTTIINEYNNGYAQNILRNPEKLAKFMLYDKYGEQGIKYLQSRAIEKATLEKKQTELNIPPTTQGGANRVEITTQTKNGIDRLSQDPRYQ